MATPPFGVPGLRILIPEDLRGMEFANARALIDGDVDVVIVDIAETASAQKILIDVGCSRVFCIRCDLTSEAGAGRLFSQSAPVLRAELDVVCVHVGTVAEQDILAFTGVPQRHWRQSWSTYSLGRAHEEIKRRIDVVGGLPNLVALLRLAGAVLIEQCDEQKDGDRRYFSEVSMLEVSRITTTAATIEAVAVIPELRTA